MAVVCRGGHAIRMVTSETPSQQKADRRPALSGRADKVGLPVVGLAIGRRE
jgi:hypothetical protein